MLFSANEILKWDEMKEKSHYQAKYMSEILSKKGQCLNVSIFTFPGAS